MISSAVPAAAVKNRNKQGHSGTTALTVTVTLIERANSQSYKTTYRIRYCTSICLRGVLDVFVVVILYIKGILIMSRDTGGGFMCQYVTAEGKYANTVSCATLI